MLNKIQEQLNKSESFFSLINRDMGAAANMLGGLYLTLNNADSTYKSKVDNAINSIQSKLTSENIKGLWRYLNSLSEFDWNIMLQGNKEPLEALRKVMIQDIRYLKHIDKESLIQLGQNVGSYRTVYVALIQKHLDEKKHKNPFSNSDFSFKTLSIGSAEENHLYLFKYLNQCSSLPIEDIVALGKTEAAIANNILKDLSIPIYYFRVSEQFAVIHESLRLEIANAWKNSIEIQALSSSDKQVVLELLSSLQTKYAIFNQVKLDSRLERTQPYGENHRPIFGWDRIKGVVGGGVVIAGTGWTLIAIAPPTACICIPFYMLCGGSWLASMASLLHLAEKHEQSANNKNKVIQCK